MQIKFLQTKTALACFAGVAMTCFWGGTVSCFAMDEYDVYQEVNRAVDHAVWAAERSREAKEEAEKEKRKQYAFKTGKFSDDCEGEEFKKEYRSIMREKKVTENLLNELDEAKEDAPYWVSQFAKNLDSLSEQDRGLWEVWDEERNWREYYDYVTDTIFHASCPPAAYQTNFYYTKLFEGMSTRFARGPAEKIEESGFIKERVHDMNRFLRLNKKNKVPDEIRELQAFRQKIDIKYKKVNKSQHRLLFPGKKEERCITS